MTFTPMRVTITNITQANPAVVTTSDVHNLATGEVVRLKIPKAYGMIELDNQLLQITNLTTTTFSLQYSQNNPVQQINVDSTDMTAFVNAGTGTPAAFVAAGSAATPITNPSAVLPSTTCDSLIWDATMNNSTSPIPF